MRERKRDRERNSNAPPLGQEDGRMMYAGGSKAGRMEVLGARRPLKGHFDVRDVRKTIIAISGITKCSQCARFDNQRGNVVDEDFADKIQVTIE